MDNASTVLYEYFLNDGEVRKQECTIIENHEFGRRGANIQFVRENLYGSKFISRSDLGVVRNNHIYALDDDIEKYTEVFIAYVEAKAKNLQQQLYKNKKVLKKLKREDKQERL